jgi:putative ABC transport system permease protein
MMTFIRTVLVGIATSFIEMRTHKLRSLLSVLGVLLGVAALVAMLTLIGGIDLFLREKMANWTGALWIWSSSEPSADERVAWNRSPGLRLSDGRWLGDSVEAVGEVYEQIERQEDITIAGAEIRHCRIRGVSKKTFNQDSATITLDRGRLLSEADYARGTRICMVSWGIVERVERQQRSGSRRGKPFDIIGTLITYNGVQYRVVGTLKPVDEDFEPRWLSRMIIMPLLTMQQYVVGFDADPGSLNISVADAQQLDEQTDAIVKALSSRHRGAQDFSYRGAEWAENMSSMLNNISFVMSIVSAVSLLVGGMGIMNVMLASISERLKEIGVRKAIGARNSQIFVQFVAETFTLSVVGGTLGAAIGLLPLLFGQSIQQATDGAIVPTILPLHAVLVFVIVTTVGVVFGLYPALKASRMDPITALRYE